MDDNEGRLWNWFEGAMRRWPGRKQEVPEHVENELEMARCIDCKKFVIAMTLNGSEVCRDCFNPHPIEEVEAEPDIDAEQPGNDPW